VLAVGLGMVGAGAYGVFQSLGLNHGMISANGWGILLSSLLALAGIAAMSGLYVMEPNYSAVLQFFGSYVGTDRSTGLRWVNPLYSVHKVSCRVQTTEIPQVKVNDQNGNPIEIAAAVVWRVSDAARALLQVEDYEDYIGVQAETCLRHLASSHPYDHHYDPETPPDAVAKDAASPEPTARARVPSLLDGGEVITADLVRELSERLAAAGIAVDEARITHLAYAPEIAPAMLRRQQAQAVIAAKAKIVKGAVDMCEDAVKQLKSKDIEIEGDRLTALVSNLLVVLVSDKDASPVVNAGSIYG
jgi:regulator of protease activity HflC (stomatin/prohibitin superfamily)